MVDTVPTMDASDKPFGDTHGPWLSGPYAPVFDESVFESLEVIGEVPTDLNGVYVRNGPNPRFEPEGVYHPFDGDGMLHAVYFDRGRVAVKNRWVRTRGLADEERAGRSVFASITRTIKESTEHRLKDTANTDVLVFGGELVASWYMSGALYRVAPKTLETLGTIDLPCSVSSHAKTDPVTGELVFFDYASDAPFMRFGVLGRDGHSKVEPIDLPGPRLPHDMAITERYGIVHDHPLLRDEEAKKRGRHRLVFAPELPTRFGVVPRGEGAVRWFEFEPCFVYHVANAWEEGDEVVMIACRFLPRKTPAGAIDAVGTARAIAELTMNARPWRYRMNLRTGEAREEVIDPDANLEFPTVDGRRVGRETRFVYLVEHHPDRLQWTGIRRLDLASGASERFSDAGSASYYSEPWFAPRDGSEAEDDGYVVVLHYDAQERRQEVQVFDARTLSRGPLARLRVPRRIPVAFHAVWARPSELV